MKKLYILLLVCLAGIQATGQTIIYREPFDGMYSYTLTGWGYSFSGPVPWQCGLPHTVGGCMPPIGGPMSANSGPNKVACFAECGTINHNDTNVLTYTPIINMSAVSGAWFKYDSYFEKYANSGDTEKATVEVSVDNGSTWTVLQHVPANYTYSKFVTYYIDMAAYSHVSNLRIGFRYNDGGGNMLGWAIDNVTVFVPARKDLSLLSVTPGDSLLSYVRSGTGYVHQYEVYNAGLDTVRNFVLSYQRGTGAVKSDTITGVVLPPFATATYTHGVPDTVPAQGHFSVKAWLSLAGDALHYNDSAATTLRGADFIPAKVLAIESGEGTTNGWSPRNMVYLQQVPLLDIKASIISVHEYDPMQETVYHDFLFNLRWNYVPYILFDRRVSVPLDSFFDYLEAQSHCFAFADLRMTGTIAANVVSVTGTVTPAINLTGDYRLALVITEDGVTGTDTVYDQSNNYAAGALGPMGGYETKPNPVPAASMVYDHVARMIYPDPEGQTGLLPGVMLSSTPYNFSMSATIDPSLAAGKLKAAILLIKHGDSTILNSAQMKFYLNEHIPVQHTLNAELYPNPADEESTVAIYLQNSQSVNIVLADIAGHTLLAKTEPGQQGNNKFTVPVSNLATGIYLVGIHTAEGEKIWKVEVKH